MKPGNVAPRSSGVLNVGEGPETTVLVAVESAHVREALAAMLGAIDGFSVVAEAADDVTALASARGQQPRLVLIEPELSECGGWWVIQQIRAEQPGCVVVALGRSANGTLARLAGAQTYVQMGVSPRDLLSALQAALSYRAPARSGTAQAEHHLLADGDAVLGEPALVHF